MTFNEWFYKAPHRAKYTNDHPAYLAAQEAWEARAVAEPHKWVELTDEEAKSVNFPHQGVCYVYPSEWEEVGLPFVRAIEAKLKEKNGF